MTATIQKVGELPQVADVQSLVERYLSESEKHNGQSADIKFYTKYEQTDFKEDGMPIKESIERIKIYRNGGLDWNDYKVTDEYRKKYALQYAQFKQDQEQRPAGVQLEDCGFIPTHHIEQFHYVRIFTLEQLLDADASLVVRVDCGLEYQKKAKPWMEAISEIGKTAKLKKELKARDRKLEALEQQMKQFQEAYEKQTGAKLAPEDIVDLQNLE